MRVCLACYQVLQAAQDPRAGEVLDTAHALLRRRAATIPDEGLGRLYVENVPWHREVVAAAGNGHG